MKQTLLFCLFTIFSFPLFSQCEPDETYRDSAIGVYPPPMSMDNPDGGITESACINAGYEFVLTFKIPGTFSIATLDSIIIEPEGAILNLPTGMDYDCNPPNCKFTPADTIACLVINGTATDVDDIGVHDLMIVTNIYTNVTDDELIFPTPLIDGADGNYFLTVEAEGSPDCFIVGTEDYITKNIRISNSPNPFSTITNIEIVSSINERLDFKVFDLLGNMVHQKNIEVFEGANNFQFDGTHLANGIYTFSLSNKLGAITRKIVVSR